MTPNDQPEMTRTTLIMEAQLKERLDRVVPHGWRKHVLGTVIELVVTAIEAEGDAIMGALVAKQYKLVRDTSREAA